MHDTYFSTHQWAIEKFIKSALTEDVGSGDLTAMACLNEKTISKATVLSKESGVIAGVFLAKKIFQTFDHRIAFFAEVSDGDEIKENQILFAVKGPERSILSAERVVLNTIQRMSGIATLTAQVQNEIGHTKCKVLDTRKTTPNFRIIEKWAVRIGGGLNHRMGLYDTIMIKDNHIDFCGSIEKAISKALAFKRSKKIDVPIIVETRSLSEVEKCLPFSGQLQRVLFDNMNLKTLEEAVILVNNTISTEASGGITIRNVREIAETGVDFVSMGSIIYHATIIDMSLKATII